MKNELLNLGFKNVSVVPNFKELTVIGESDLVYGNETPYRLCTFSRVMKEKGIETAIDAVRSVNSELGYKAFSLDIYGQVDPEQTEWFKGLAEKLTQGRTQAKPQRVHGHKDT